MPNTLERRPLGSTGLMLSAIGFGAFKIGRNVGIKYASGYELPSDDESDRLLRGVIDLGINYVDTAPAYGLSEERVGRVLGPVRDVIISTKVGETFSGSTSHFDLSERAVRESLALSRQRLQRDTLDLVFVHAFASDAHVLNETDVVATLQAAKQRGETRFIGYSARNFAGVRAALDWADAVMVEHHLENRINEHAIKAAAERGVGVVVKKGLASGKLPPREAIQFVVGNPHVTSMVVGGLNLEHLRQNILALSETPHAGSDEGRPGSAGVSM
jgi:aryl-alcohol dehydrogenase-like predicted oxidoreductase